MHVELHIISIKFIILIVQELVAFFLEIINDLFEVLGQLIHAFQVVLSQRLELLDGVEDINQLEHSSAEKVKLSEDLSLGEVEGLAFGHVDHFFLGLLVAVFVLLVQLDATGEDFDQLSRVSTPNVVALFSIQDSLLAVGDHLIGNLHEQTGHLVRGVKESSNGVDHLNCVHQSRQCVDDLLGSSII